MKGKISIDGFLSIMRVVDYELQVCPFTNRVTDKEDSFPCGDWCPLFGEPKTDSGGSILISAIREAYDLEPIEPPTHLELCKKELTFSDFDDERGCR